MIALLRVGAYLVSTITVWQFFQGDTAGINALGIHRHLMLDAGRGQILGVCAGFSNFTGIDVTLIRLLWFLTILYRGVGILLYIIAFLIMPVAG